MTDILLISLENNTNSIGIRSISAYLKKVGYKPTLLFLPNFLKPNEAELKEIVLFIKSLNPRFIGLSLMSYAADSAILLSRYIKADTKIPVIWGGIHATMCPDESLKYADMVCVGDGEIACSHLLRPKKNGTVDLPLGVKNIWFKNGGGGIIKNPFDIPTKNYDFLPFLDYSLEDNYILSEKKVLTLSSDLFDKHLTRPFSDFDKEPSYIIAINRGCIFNCSFCSNAKYNEIYGRCNRLRGYSIQRTINELEHIKKFLTLFKNIYINDLDFFQNSLELTKEFCNAYVERVGLPFATYLSSNMFCHEKFKLLVDAGLSYCEIGIQSLSRRINSKIFNRPLNLNKLLELLKKSKDTKDLFFTFDLMIQNPYMDFYGRAESFIASLRIAKVLFKCKTRYRFFLHALQHHPGTKLTERIKKDRFPERKLHSYIIKNWVIEGPLFYFPFISDRFAILFLTFPRRVVNTAGKALKFITRILKINEV